MSFASLFSGKRKAPRDPSHPTDPVRAHSWDVDDAKAKPGQRIGDGSREQGWAFSEALRATAKDIYSEHRKTDYEGRFRMHRTYLVVLDALLQLLDFKSGELVPSYAAIAERSETSVNTAKRAIAAFEFWGLLSHVRRSRRIEDAEGQAAPQRAQTSNAYYFDCRRKMTSRTWTRFWSRLLFNLKKVGALVARRAAVFAGTFNEVAKPAPRPSDEKLATVLERMRRDHFADDPVGGASASPTEVRYPELTA
jgi:hypothetical protein